MERCEAVVTALTGKVMRFEMDSFKKSFFVMQSDLEAITQKVMSNDWKPEKERYLQAKKYNRVEKFKELWCSGGDEEGKEKEEGMCKDLKVAWPLDNIDLITSRSISK